MAKKLWVNQTVANPDGQPFYIYNGQPIMIFYQENQPTQDFQDLTDSIVGWYNFGEYVLDYDFVRSNIQSLVIAIVGQNFANWNNLTLEEKQIACYFIVAPYALRVPAIVTDEQDKENWKHLLTSTKRDRNNCGEAMRLAVGEYIRTGGLTLEQTQQFFRDVSEYLYWFIEANIPDFKNYIFGLPPFEGVFESKDYYSVGLQQKLMDIYNGVA